MSDSETNIHSLLLNKRVKKMGRASTPFILACQYHPSIAVWLRLPHNRQIAVIVIILRFTLGEGLF